ncbi:MAG: SUMF1/EgtB/PvdO family nonheme iron enzyme [Chloroflexota bacterium]
MKLFISYSSQDRELVTALADDLELMDHVVWFDRELNRSGGHQWWKLICEQIRACDGFIYALSPHVLSSEPCKREYGYARDLGKPVLPLIVADLDYRYLPRHLQESQLVNFRTRSSEQRRGLRDSLRNLPACPPLPPNALQLEPAAPLDPVGVLIDRIHTLTADPDQQKALVRDIDDLDEDAKYAEHVPELLRLLMARDDVLTVRNLRRAQELLSKARTVVTKSSPALRIRPRSIDLLPAPFAWIEIPHKGYSIAKYPITNTQYRLFVEAGGYRERKWWTDAGWEAKAKGWIWKDSDWVATNTAWTEPRYWTDSKWNGTEQPVVGVSWYESVAFCLWLSEATGEKIMLPTEDQWQYAAQGDDGRDYPWGKQWDGNRCNNNVDRKGVGQTTPVRQYEDKGDSSFGVVDMVGNVREWCLTDYKNKTNDVNSTANRCALRGGSWNSNSASVFRCDYRFTRTPRSRHSGRGFRIALSL